MANLYGYNTSTAHKIYEPDISYGQNLHREIHTQKVKTRRQAEKTPKTKNSFAGFISAMIIFAMAFAVVSGYVAINEANNEISALAGEYNDIVASNQAIQVKIDKAIDLNQLQTVAGERFGMIRPERYQMFYVDLDMNDYSEKTSDKVKTEKEEKIASMGVPGVITGALNIFR